jgi:hypothetical protein
MTDRGFVPIEDLAADFPAAPTLIAQLCDAAERLSKGLALAQHREPNECPYCAYDVKAQTERIAAAEAEVAELRAENQRLCAGLAAIEEVPRRMATPLKKMRIMWDMATTLREGAPPEGEEGKAE